MSQSVKIYPSNWLITAGIVGFERIFRDINRSNIFFKITENYLEISDLQIFKELFFSQYFLKSKELEINLNHFYHNSRVSNNAFKKNKEIDCDRTKKYFFEDIESIDNLYCSFCNERNAIRREGKIVMPDEVHFTPLGASPTKLKNFYWEGRPNNFLCLYCELIIYCTAFGFTKTSQNKYLFVYAPTKLEEIIDINNVLKEYVNKSFNSSFIEILKKKQYLKAKWSLQNISIIELAPIFDNKGKSATTFNIFHNNIPVEVAEAIRKMIQSYPDTMSIIYDIFLNYLYERKSLYDLAGYVLHGYFNKDKLKRQGEKMKNLENTQVGRLVLFGTKLKNDKLKDLLFFLKFQREVDKYDEELD